MDRHYPISRRHVLRLGAGLGAAILLAACGSDDATPTRSSAGVAPTTGAAPGSTPTRSAVSTTGATPTARPAGSASPAASPAGSPTAGGGRPIVGDVLDYSLEAAGRWKGPFGSVTLKLHRGFFNGEAIWYIRTDASAETFAKDNGLVYVPLLKNALQAPGSFAKIYLFERGASGQGAIVTTIPGRDDFTSAFRVYRVTFSGEPRLLNTESAVQAEVQAGRARVEETDIIVNYPLVGWPGGGLPVDPDLAEPLGKGPLIEKPDTATGGKVTFKLHQCFPGSRYIVTDTSAVPMAPMMGVVGSAPTQKLKDAGAVAPITIFLNGLKGPGVMGFQPAIFNTSAGDPAWSPFWDHFAVEWKDPGKATVLRSQAELDQRVRAGDLTRYNGVPDTHPNGFVVNCPAPVLAPNTYTGA